MAQSRITVGENQYIVDINNILTVGRMKRIKEWYGPNLGRFGPFLMALNELDPDAILCLVWMARSEKGEANVPTPNEMADFKFSEFTLEDVIEPPSENGVAEGEDVAEGQSPTPTPDSPKATPTSSGESGSDPSPKSATSPAATSKKRPGSTS